MFARVKNRNIVANIGMPHYLSDSSLVPFQHAAYDARQQEVAEAGLSQHRTRDPYITITSQYGLSQGVRHK